MSLLPVLSLLQQGKIATLLMPNHRDDRVMFLAIQYMYGIGLADIEEGGYMCGFHWFAMLAATAERYEIAGLAEYSFETACRIMDDLSDDPFEVCDFFEGFSVNDEICHSDPSHTRFALRFLMENLAKLRDIPAFQEVCSGLPMIAVGVVNFVAENPKLAVDFVKFVAELQTGTEVSK